MARTATHDEVIDCQARTIGLLNQVEALLTGWVLGHDRDEIAKLTEPLYELLDKDPA